MYGSFLAPTPLCTVATEYHHILDHWISQTWAPWLATFQGAAPFREFSCFRADVRSLTCFDQHSGLFLGWLWWLRFDGGPQTPSSSSGRSAASRAVQPIYSQCLDKSSQPAKPFPWPIVLPAIRANCYSSFPSLQCRWLVQGRLPIAEINRISRQALPVRNNIPCCSEKHQSQTPSAAAVWTEAPKEHAQRPR